MSYEKLNTKFNQVFILKPKIFFDERGYFFESFNRKKFDDLNFYNKEFVQDNVSFSKKNVLRGLHFQINNPQAKLISVLKGKIFDVIVDLRKNSETFGLWESFTLSAKKNINCLFLKDLRMVFKQ